jgi:23S rRNA (guanosine2251-2'-O)-methyltransferase
MPNESKLVKTTSGALDCIKFIYVTNIVHTIQFLKKYGYWCYGIDLNQKYELGDLKFSDKSILVFGSEANGIRPLVKKHCDFLVSINTSNSPYIDSLNVTNAAAIVLYKIYNQLIFKSSDCNK